MGGVLHLVLLSKSPLIFVEESWVVIYFLEKLFLRELVVDLQLFPGKSELPLLCTVRIINGFESFRLINVSKNLPVRVSHMINILFS